MADKTILTKDSYERLAAELEQLKVVTRKEIAEKIKIAREQGDLSENAEYDAAKDEQRDIEARIEELEKTLESAEVLDESTIDFNKVHVGSFVKVRETKSKKELVYQIVDKSEIDIFKGKISYESPIGKALMDKEVGKTVTVEAPQGTAKYKILEIKKADH